MLFERHTHWFIPQCPACGLISIKDHVVIVEGHLPASSPAQEANLAAPRASKAATPKALPASEIDCHVSIAFKARTTALLSGGKSFCSVFQIVSTSTLSYS